MLKSCRTATRRSERRRAVHRLRIFSGFAVGLMLCAVVMASPPLEWTAAHAQQFAAAKKRVERKGPEPKAAPKEQQERSTFTAQDEDVAVIPGIPDARIWGDSEQEFAVVTGVSIGALIAPFAFLGPRYDEVVHKNFTTIGAADIFEDRTTRDSLFDYWPLKRVIEQRVTPALLSEIAAEHARGRRLFVATTNLDAGRRVVWNMGAIAARGEEGLKLFRDVLLASSSIPGFFSPVPIEVEANGKKFHELHSDGTLTAPFFVVPDTMLSPRGATRPPFGQLYIIVNSKLGPEFKMPDRNIPGILGRSIGVALTAALRAEVMLVYIGAQRHGITLRIAHVDPSFDHPSRGPFDGQYMQALYEVGVAAGKKGTAFGDTLPELSMHGSGGQQ